MQLKHLDKNVRKYFIMVQKCSEIMLRFSVGTNKLSPRSPGKFLAHQQKVGDRDMGLQNILDKTRNMRLIRPVY